MDQLRFEKVCAEWISSVRDRAGIGTLAEKTLHAVLKNYFEPDSSYQEVKIHNYIADIARKQKIIEIQSRGFQAIVPKLSTFLVENSVTVVYPIVASKQIFWLNKTTMAVESTRKSNKNGKLFDLLPELYHIRKFLNNPNLHVCAVIVNAMEYRLLNGYGADKKNHATKFDLVPSALLDEIYFEKAEDYLLFLPDALPEHFTSADFCAAFQVSMREASAALGVLHAIGLIEKTGKIGRAFCYKRINFPFIHINGIKLT